MNDNNNHTIALLIDAENVSHRFLDILEEELAMLGRVTIKKCYGDFTKKNLDAWDADFLNKHSLEMVQQHAYTNGKNSSDIRLAIDAMDVLYEKNVNAICIMSSDSDFTGLAIRLKKSNVFVWGAGEAKTPQSFINVCDRFFTLKDATPLHSPSEEIIDSDEKMKKEEILQWVERLLSSQYNEGVDSGLLATKIRQRYPDFDWTSYGAKKFPDFFPKDKFEARKVKNHSNITIVLK